MGTSMKKAMVLAALAAAAVFAVNNILLTRFILSLPGGSGLGIFTVLAVIFISMATKRFGTLPAFYLTYGLIGLPSHLWSGDFTYLLLMMSLTSLALLLDLLLHRFRYKLPAYLCGWPAFIIALHISSLLLPRHLLGSFADFLLITAAGLAGILLAYGASHLIKPSTRRAFQ